MFVRTKEGKIFDCLVHEQMGKPIYYPKTSETNGYIDWNEAYKKSENIIDILEVGDIIKFDITDTDNYAEIQGYNCLEISCEEELNGVKEMIEMESAKLLSIVTKEQFKSISYEVSK